MTAFDKEIWKERAWNRLTRYAKKDSKKNDTSWFFDLVAIDNVEKIVEWCTIRGIKVEFSSKGFGSYCTATKTIKIPSKLRPERQVYYLLHECGHHLVNSDPDHFRFGMGYPYSEDPIVKKTFHHRVSCLEEELESWARGWRLAGRLGLNVNQKEFDKVKLTCIKTYIKWTLDPTEDAPEE